MKRRQFLARVLYAAAFIAAPKTLFTPPVAEEKILWAGYSFGIKVVQYGKVYDASNCSFKGEWDGKTVVTVGPTGSRGVYDVNSRWCPPGIKYHARRIIIAAT